MIVKGRHHQHHLGHSVLLRTMVLVALVGPLGVSTTAAAFQAVQAASIVYRLGNAYCVGNSYEPLSAHRSRPIWTDVLHLQSYSKFLIYDECRVFAPYP